MAHLEALQATCPNDPEPWMLHALEQIDFNPQELTKGNSLIGLCILSGMAGSSQSQHLQLVCLVCLCGVMPSADNLNSSSS